MSQLRSQKINLYDLSLEELDGLMESWEQPSYRADQIWTWLYEHLETNIDAMSSLPKSLRTRLKEQTRVEALSVVGVQESLSGETRKDLLELPDGETIEVVLMRYIDRRTACISTQVGCSIGCLFCATGQMGLNRNLTSGEIMAQVLHFERELAAQDEHLTNVVLMGMGEPFFNYENTMAALYRMIHQKGFRMGQRRITVSTAGVASAVRRFAREDTQINLAVSLHAATDDLRNELVPLNRRFPLDALFDAIQFYIDRTNREVTFEWVLIDGVNDTVEQAEALAARLAGMLAHVNLIPLNPTEGYEGRPSAPDRIEQFTDILEQRHISHTLRLRRGIDIRAGCGQLRAQNA